MSETNKNGNDTSINTEDSIVVIPRFGAPDCMSSCKSELQQELQQSGSDLPKYENKNFGEPHNLRWSSTIIFGSGSKVSVAAIFKSKKDADKAAAFKARKIGLLNLINDTVISNENYHDDIGLLLKCFEDSGSEVDKEISEAHKAGRYKGINYRSLIPSAMIPTVQTSTPKMSKETVNCVRREYTMDGKTFLDEEGRLELPFLFPLKVEENSIVSTLCESCLKSETLRRQIFAFGRMATWRTAWMQSLNQCIANQGVIIVSPEMESMVIEALKAYTNANSIVHVQTPGSEPEPPMSCMFNSDILQHVNLNKLFPTERPILLIDASMRWSVTWQLMVFFPTFHIASFCLYESDESSPVIQINMLRDVYNCDLITQVYE